MDFQTYQMIDKAETIQVKAIQLTEQNAQEVAHWLGSKVLLVVGKGLQVETFRGVYVASYGDYIVRDNLGEIHVRKSQIFDRVFSKVDGINGYDHNIKPT